MVWVNVESIIVGVRMELISNIGACIKTIILSAPDCLDVDGGVLCPRVIM